MNGIGKKENPGAPKKKNPARDERAPSRGKKIKTEKKNQNKKK